MKSVATVCDCSPSQTNVSPFLSHLTAGLCRTSSGAALETSAPLAAAVAELSNAISELDALAFQDKKQPPQGPQLVATLRAFAVAADNAHRHGTLALAHCRLVHLAVRDLLVAGRAGCLDAVLQLSVSQDLQQVSPSGQWGGGGGVGVGVGGGGEGQARGKRHLLAACVSRIGNHCSTRLAR